ncbi:hypothetical protein C8R43DRAFT_1199950, partial [Mycena crocata]
TATIVPPELVQLVIYHAWGCISTGTHRHCHSMAQWMLASRDWLNTVSVVLCKLWIISGAHIKYIAAQMSPLYVNSQVSQTSIGTLPKPAVLSQSRTRVCADLIEFATIDPNRDILLPGLDRYAIPTYAIPCQSVAIVIRDFIPEFTSFHFVLIDCTATYRMWDTASEIPSLTTSRYRRVAHCLRIHTLLRPRPPAGRPATHLLSPTVSLGDVSRVSVPRGAEAGCAGCECGSRRLYDRGVPAVESTAGFWVGDVPRGVPSAKFVVVRLSRTTTWGLTGSDIPRRRNSAPPTKPCDPKDPARKKGSSLWQLLKRLFRDYKHKSASFYVLNLLPQCTIFVFTGV